MKWIEMLLQSIIFFVMISKSLSNHTRGGRKEIKDQSTRYKLIPVEKNRSQGTSKQNELTSNSSSMNNSTMSFLSDEVGIVKISFPHMAKNTRNMTETQNKKDVDDLESNYYSSIFSFACMAISLGAISARRLMTKEKKICPSKCLCWERNGRLEESLTYDIAFTTIPMNYDYGSFYQTTWNGGLDKFDV